MWYRKRDTEGERPERDSVESPRGQDEDREDCGTHGRPDARGGPYSGRVPFENYEPTGG